MTDATDWIPAAVRRLALPASTRRALLEHRTSERLRAVVRRLSEGIPLALVEHQYLRSLGLAEVSALGYSLAFQRTRGLSKAIGAAVAWRHCGQSLRALEILSEAELGDEASPQAIYFTVTGALLADRLDLESARMAGIRALTLSEPWTRAKPQRVLARIARLRGYEREWRVRVADARLVEAYMAEAPKPASGRYSRELALDLMRYHQRVPVNPAFETFDRDRKAFGRRYRDEYLRSEAWAQRRAPVLVRADGLCEQCGTRRPLDVHHLTYVRLTREDTKRDLVALCRPCHTKEHDAALKVRAAVRLAIGATPARQQ